MIRQSRGDEHEEFQNEVNKQGGWGGWIPLHLACKHDPPFEVIKTLLEVLPSKDKPPQHLQCDIYNRVPLHYLAEHGVTDERSRQSNHDVVSVKGRHCQT